MSAPVVWILAFASVVLLITGGFTVAVARFRGRVMARRRQAAKLGAQLEGKPNDPFGELQVIGDQLRKIQERLGESEDVAGLPVQSAAGAISTVPQQGSPVTGELEQDLDLFKKELYTKTHRIDELVAEKQVLAEKIVTLENALAAAPAASTPGRRPKPTESNMALVDVLQGEADELRGQIAERDLLLKSLEKSDTSGLVKEVGRIRQELLDRNDELNTLRTQHADTGQAQQLQTRLQALVTEKEGLAARALETAGKLRQANERIGELEQSLVSRSAVAFAGATTPPPVPPQGLPHAPPKVPMPKITPSPRLTPAPRADAQPPAPPAPPAPPPPRSPGFPDEPTIKTSAPRMTPVPRSRERRRTGSIFPAPGSKKDLLD